MQSLPSSKACQAAKPDVFLSFTKQTGKSFASYAMPPMARHIIEGLPVDPGSRTKRYFNYLLYQYINVLRYVVTDEIEQHGWSVEHDSLPEGTDEVSVHPLVAVHYLHPSREHTGGLLEDTQGRSQVQAHPERPCGQQR